MNKRKITKIKEEDLILFSNGPGEVSTWVFPIVERIRKSQRLKDKYNIVLIIHPCQFSSGTEHVYASKLNLFDEIIPPSDYIKLIFGLRSSRKYGLKKKGKIISLGGDLLHPILFRFRTRGDYKLYAYTNNPGWGKKYEKIFVRNDYIKEKSAKRGVDPNKIIVSGDLVYSSIKVLAEREKIRAELSLNNDDLMMLFMPGSREFEVKYMLPVYLKVIHDITDEFKNVKPFILKSPYIDYRLINKTLINAPEIKEAEVESGELLEWHHANHRINYAVEITGDKLIPILEGGLEYWGNAVDLAVTVPGTNTIQLAYRGIPALVIAALNKPEIIPVEGVAGLLKWLPGGKILLRKAAKKYVSKFPFASLPNIYMQKEIFPELFGVIQTQDIVEKLKTMQENDEIEKIKSRLKVFEFDRDPADFIVSEVFHN